MKSVKLTFGSLVLVAMLVVSLVSSGFSQTVLAGNITIKQSYIKYVPCGSIQCNNKAEV